MQQINRFSYISTEQPALEGTIRGGSEFPDIEGIVFAYWLDNSLYFQTEFTGLPPDRIFGFHVHDGLICGDPDGVQPFTQAGGHLSNCPDGTWCARHPYHLGDLPPIFSDGNGYAAMGVFLGKARISDFSGKPLVLHSMPDDFTTQPAGSSGKRIACGILTEVL